MDPYSEIEDNKGYCVIKPVVESKIDEILERVRRIDSTISLSPALKPSVPPKPGTRTGPQKMPPPIPVKSTNWRTSSCTARKVLGQKILEKDQCEFLTVQLKSVRDYLDKMVDDDFDDKLDNLRALDTAIGALAFQ